MRSCSVIHYSSPEPAYIFVLFWINMIRRQKRSFCSLMPFIRSHLASAGRAAGQRGGQDGQPGWPAVQPSPWAKQMKCLNVLLPSVPCSGSPATKPSLCGTPADPCSPASLLLFFSAVPPFIRLTSISEIRITWSGEETLQTRQICFQPRKNQGAYRLLEGLG